MKRTILLLLALCMSLCLLSVTVGAEEPQTVAAGKCGNTMYFNLDTDGLLTITGSGHMNTYESGTAPWYAYKDQIKEIVFLSKIVSIGDYAFAGLENVTTVTLPSESMNAIYDHSFDGCTSLTTINVRAAIGSIGEYAFANCTSLTTFDLGGKVKKIGNYTFYGCAALESVDSENVTSIGNSAFSGCTALNSIDLENVTYIGGSAFYGCVSLTEVLLPECLGTLCPGAFENCTGLTSITVPAGVDHVQCGVFMGCTNLKTVVLQDGITAIASSAFTDCISLTEINIPEGVTYIAASAFENCSSLASLELPASLRSIGRYAFYGCSGLTTINIPNGVETINELTFYGCSALTSITIPATVTTIHDRAFSWCEGLKTVFFEGSAPAFGKLVFWLAPANVYYPMDDATWTAEAIPTDGSATWAPLQDLAITTQPVGQKLKAGETAQFSVQAQGVELRYQWQYRSGSKAAWKNCAAEGNATPTMNLKATRVRSGLQYRCVITDYYGNTVTSKTVYLYVLAVKTQPTTQKVKAGTTAQFTVSATGYGKSYQWQYKTPTGTWKNATAKGCRAATLSVPATTGRSNYQYRCKITDSAGNVTYSKAAYLYVLGIKTQPTAKTAKAGSTVTFSVTATGHNKTYQWQYQSADGTWKNCTGSGNKRAIMSFKAQAAFNGRLYRCVITDSAGNQLITKTVALTVK